MREVIFSNSNFVFFMYSGTGVNDTPFESLRVASIGDADKYVVEVRLNTDIQVFTGKPVQYKYHDAVAFAERINSWLSENPEWSVER